MKLWLIIRHQIRLFSKTLNILVLLIAAPLFLIFTFGQAFSAIWDKGGFDFRALDYFGITLLTLVVFNGAQIASWGIHKEKKSNTETRLSLAPIKKDTVLFGTFLGTWIILSLLTFLLVFLAHFILSVDYGPSIGPVLLLLAAETLLAVSLGVSLAFLLQEKAANALLQSLIPLICFLGGCYAMIPESGVLHSVSFISPLRWVNLALMASARGGDNRYLLPALLFCAGLSALFLALTGIRLRRHS
ncbi:MAG: ABC transporter permease [Spirochaetales bacterium]|nr:ABC transporter permease [Spirochaetales bacterium]